MIQTHFVRLEPPYQVIFCNGEIGLQIGSLIAVEEKRDKKGGYSLVTHTHPVVNYGSKDTLKIFSGGRTSVWTSPGDYAQGAVWDKAEVTDVLVIGLMSEEDHTIMNEEGFADLVYRTLVYRIQQKQHLTNSIYYLNRSLRLLGMAPNYGRPAHIDVNMESIDFEEVPYIQISNADLTIQMAVPLGPIKKMKDLLYRQIREYQDLFSKGNSMVRWSFNPIVFDPEDDDPTLSKEDQAIVDLAKEMNALFDNQ